MSLQSASGVARCGARRLPTSNLLLVLPALPALPCKSFSFQHTAHHIHHLPPPPTSPPGPAAAAFPPITAACSAPPPSPSATHPNPTMSPRAPLLPALALLILSARTRAAFVLELARGANVTSYSTGVSLTVGLPSSVTGGTANAGRRPSHAPPGDDADPPGVRIYDSLDAVPTARLLAHAARHKKCFPKRQTACWAPYVCGHRCEQILLAVDGYCKKSGARDLDGSCMEGRACNGPVRWRRCKKARKFNRCFARVCYRRRAAIGVDGGVLGTPRPMSYEDTDNVAIVRYRRPLPKHEVLARRNRQSSTQSAIFK